MLSLVNAQSILLVSPHRLGDTLFATPGIRALRNAKPHSQMDGVTLSTVSYQALNANTAIDTLYQAKDLCIATLARRYDVVLPLQNIKVMRAYLKEVPNVLMLPIYNHLFHYSENFYRFVAEQLPAVRLAPLSPYEIYWTAADAAYSDALLQAIPSTSKPFIVALHMGCHRLAKADRSILHKLFPSWLTKDSRSWSFERYNQLIQQLLTHYPQAYVILTGTANESVAATAITAHPRIINVIAKTNVAQLAALLKRCDVLLTGDTGPMHLACAVKIAILLLCGKTDPAHTGPYPKQNNHIIIQRQGMQSISVDEVYDALCALMPSS